MEATDRLGLLAAASAAASSAASSAAPHGVTHLYVHLPFCRTRCAYCDFTSEVIGPHLRSGSLALYVDAIRRELALVEPLLSRPLETVYVGGGTPTAVPADLLRDLLADLGRLVGSGSEFTVEANPENIDEATLSLLSSQGVTRLSLGVQSFLPSGLAALGRRTPSGATTRALDVIRRTRWEEWSLDLVFGMPGQDLPALEYDLEAAVAARPPHISVYDLTYTDHYARRLESRQGPQARETAPAREAAEDFSETHYATMTDRLGAAGYRRYEVSNFALPGHESRHNLGYWRGEDYLGLGAASVSTVGERRWTQPGSVASYLAGAPAEVEMLSPAVRRFERAMLGLRTAEGVPEAVVSEAIDAEELQRCVELGLVQRCCATLRLSPRGLDLGNAVLAAILRSPE